MIGSTFNRLTVLAPAEQTHKNHPRYLCRCVCGKQLTVDHYHLRSGHTKSCGCLKLEIASQRLRKHGQSHTPEFKAWSEARQRCTRRTIKNWHNYGGRGISMCERWADSFQAFIDDMGPRPSSDHSLDRIDVNGNYEPSNCRWATETVQQSNRRDSTIVEHNGQFMTITELARSIGAPQTTIYRYIRVYGLSPQDAVARYLNRQ